MIGSVSQFFFYILLWGGYKTVGRYSGLHLIWFGATYDDRCPVCLGKHLLLKAVPPCWERASETNLLVKVIHWDTQFHMHSSNCTNVYTKWSSYSRTDWDRFFFFFFSKIQSSFDIWLLPRKTGEWLQVHPMNWAERLQNLSPGVCACALILMLPLNFSKNVESEIFSTNCAWG